MPEFKVGKYGFIFAPSGKNGTATSGFNKRAIQIDIFTRSKHFINQPTPE